MRWTLDPNHTHIAFSVLHMGITYATGHFARYTAEITLDEETPERSSTDVSIVAASIATDNLERDAHLRSHDFLDTATWPTIHYRSGAITPLGFNTYNVEGDLTIRDVTVPVTLEVVYGGETVDPEGYRRMGFSARGYVNRERYGLTWNMPLESGGEVLGATVRVEIEAELVERPDATPLSDQPVAPAQP
ncbi:MAG TPA: YceI family protein [Ktedonobacterales bacterium]